MNYQFRRDAGASAGGTSLGLLKASRVLRLGEAVQGRRRILGSKAGVTCMYGFNFISKFAAGGTGKEKNFELFRERRRSSVVRERVLLSRIRDLFNTSGVKRQGGGGPLKAGEARLAIFADRKGGGHLRV